MVIWAPVLRQMDEGQSTVEVGMGVGISANVVWAMDKSYRESGLDSLIGFFFDARVTLMLNIVIDPSLTYSCYS